MGKEATKLTGKAKEDYDKRVAAQSEAQPEKKRRVLTDEERVARLEAELKAAREKADAKRNKVRKQATEQLNKLIAKRDELNAKIDALIDEHQLDVEPLVTEAEQAS